MQKERRDIPAKDTMCTKTKKWERSLYIWKDILSAVDWLGHRMCKKVVNRLLGILATGRFSLELDFQ